MDLNDCVCYIRLKCLDQGSFRSSSFFLNVEVLDNSLTLWPIAALEHIDKSYKTRLQAQENMRLEVIFLNSFLLVSYKLTLHPIRMEGGSAILARVNWLSSFPVMISLYQLK